MAGRSGFGVAVGAAVALAAAGATNAVTPQAMIAFIRYTGQASGAESAHLYLVNPDGGGLRKVGPGGGGYPLWSPDGRRIAFSTRDKRAALYVVNVGGFARRRLIPPRAYDCLWSSWSPDGRRIAYTRNDGCEGEIAIFVVNDDSTGRRRLTKGPADTDPVWSPDGRSILYSHATGPGRSPQLYLMNTDGGTKRAIQGTHPRAAGGIATRPPATWTTDGKKILYIDVQERLSVVTRDGRDRHQLTPRNLRVIDFALSLDGRRVVFTGGDGGHREIYLLRSTGGGLKKLTDDANDSQPSWSPDGRRIVFAGDGIYVINADGSNRTMISREGTAPAWAPTPRG